MKSQLIIITITLGVINVLIWKFSGIPLANESLILNGELADLITSNKEKFVYIIISLIISLSLLLPFYLLKSKSRIPIPIMLVVVVILLSVTANYLDINTKRLYLVNWLGDDFPFSARLLKTFIYFPIILFGVMFLCIKKIPIRSLFFLVFSGFFSGFFSFIVEIDGIQYLLIPFKKLISQGYFLFWLTLFIGLISIDINVGNNTRHEL